MPNITPYGARRTPSALLGGNKPAAGMWYEHGLIHERNPNGGYGFGTGIYEPGDAKFYGLMVYMTKPEGTIKRPEGETTLPRERPKGFFQATDISAQDRGAPSMSMSVARRRRHLSDIMAATTALGLELRTDRWLEHRGDADWLESNRVAGSQLLQPLGQARTEKRQFVRQRLPETWDVRRSLEGRFNPGSTQAVLAAVADRLVAQLAFDAKTAGSLGDRVQMSRQAWRFDLHQAVLMMRLLAWGTSAEIRQQLPQMLHDWCAVPMVYCGCYIDRLPRMSLSQDERRYLAHKAIEAELQLAQFNQVLSQLRDNPELIDTTFVTSLNNGLTAISFDGPYAPLIKQLQQRLEWLLAVQQHPEQRPANSVSSIIKGMKAILRERFRMPVSETTVTNDPWLLLPAHDNYQRRIWVAQARFGARAGE